MSESAHVIWSAKTAAADHPSVDRARAALHGRAQQPLPRELQSAPPGPDAVVVCVLVAAGEEDCVVASPVWLQHLGEAVLVVLAEKGDRQVHIEVPVGQEVQWSGVHRQHRRVRAAGVLQHPPREGGIKLCEGQPRELAGKDELEGAQDRDRVAEGLGQVLLSALPVARRGIAPGLAPATRQLVGAAGAEAGKSAGLQVV
eukprot:CAMPEP_0204519164 /NCGR_PEP_ID=MMETSP0661-20131031/4589_1 /ASSEMBLY_ACC=CAM_ASM_000606 /TAXON_ID=109239 /ORGANISM="Alexandrium margalefi, Strain AMGDE01CS-322" /LENGTH=199 /DNA_ID=CAMNT_0051524653 /DNA_START=39 /DNA_END=634 /DNA_ORIENTATION=+